MAKILYGVHGTGHGHAIRALTVARHFPQHEFLFVSHGTAAGILASEFSVWRCRNPETPVRRHRVATAAALWSACRVQSRQRTVLDSLLRVMEEFRPDAAMTDYEFFVPRACRLTGISCLSLDNQHVLSLCRVDVPLPSLPSYWVTRAAIRFLFSQASEYVVTSFFRPPRRSEDSRVSVHPPLLRETVANAAPLDGDHVVAYQGYATFPAFVPFLKSIRRRVLAYGLPGRGTDGNIVYREPSEGQFLEDLASCRYVVAGGGHTLLSEALHLGKPVLSFPIRLACEQEVNALYLERLGYGMRSLSQRPSAGLVRVFEKRLDGYRRAIHGMVFLGNHGIFARISDFLDRR